MYVKVASRFFLVAGDLDRQHRHHFLDACFLCKQDITSNRHVLMYKGDAAFCSDGCRQEQMHTDATLKAARRRHRHLLRTTSSSAAAAAPLATMTRRPTIAAHHAPVVSGRVAAI